MLFSHVKISSFRAKAHLVFHWCLYNKDCYFAGETIQNIRRQMSLSEFFPTFLSIVGAF